MPPKNSGGSTKFPGGHKVIHRTAQTAFVRVVTPRRYQSPKSRNHVTVPTWVGHSFQKHAQSFHTIEHSPLLTVESGRQLQCFSKARKVGFFNAELCLTFGLIDVIEIERFILLIIKVGIFGLISVIKKDKLSIRNDFVSIAWSFVLQSASEK